MVAACVVRESAKTIGRIGTSIVVVERKSTVGRVLAAGFVARKCLIAASGVLLPVVLPLSALLPSAVLKLPVVLF